MKHGSLQENNLDKQSSTTNGRDYSDNWEYELSNEAVLDDQPPRKRDSVMIRVKKWFFPKSEEEDEDVNETDI